MIYFDTSFLVPLVIPEETSEQIHAFFAQVSSQEMATSHWTLVEFASLLVRRVRMKEITEEAAGRMKILFPEFIEKSMALFLPQLHEFKEAKRFLETPNISLRTGDALHLAIAVHTKCERVYTLDKEMIKAGELLGIPVESGPIKY